MSRAQAARGSSHANRLRCGDVTLDLSRPCVMGVLNVTPDSFADGGRYRGREAALGRARAMVAEGADIIDVGGESTRPGAESVALALELDRVVPVIEEIAATLGVIISVDTSKPQVMREAVAAGASMVNDVNALRAPGALEVVAAGNACICLMHMQGQPRTMQEAPRYADVVGEVKAFLAERVQVCLRAGIERGRLIVDPGFGFGKTLEHNLTLLRRLDEIPELGLPVLVGLSRKSMIGRILDDAPINERVYGSIAAATLAAWAGASILRVHDVRATVDALRICDAVRRPG